MSTVMSENHLILEIATFLFGYGPEGRGFESLTAYQERKVLKPLDFQGYQDFLLSEFSQISNAGRRPPPS